MDCFKSNNFLFNSAMLPGMYAPSTYDTLTFMTPAEAAGTGGDCEKTVKNPLTIDSLGGKMSKIGEKSYFLRALYIPFDKKGMSCVDVFNDPGTHIPAILQIAPKNEADLFIIHFHGNACDAAQAGAGAERESPYFNAHYLVAEYPGYGMADGFSSETLIQACAFSVYAFVVNDLKVDPSRIVIIGRSVGTGVATYLSSKLQTLGIPPAALVLHSAYTGIRAVAADILGGAISYLFLDRWNTFDKLCVKPSSDNSSCCSDGADKVEGAASRDTYGATQAVVMTSIATEPVTVCKKTEKTGTVRLARSKAKSIVGDSFDEFSSNCCDTERVTNTKKTTGVPDSGQANEANESSFHKKEKEDDKGGKQRSPDGTEDHVPAPSGPAKLPVQLTDLVPHLSFASFSTILCPVLFIHADNDSVIDYHHSVTLHARRTRDKLPSELYTQRSNYYVRKDHNYFDYRSDYMVPVAEFIDRLVKKLAPTERNAAGGTSIVKISLSFDVLTQASMVPSQYTKRHLESTFAKRQEKEQKLQIQPKEQNNSASSQIKDDLKPKLKALPRPKAGPMGVVSLIASGCSIPAFARCCVCCLPCFCIECNVALCSYAGEALYYPISGEEQDFVYASKAQRRGSGDNMQVSGVHAIRSGTSEVVEAPKDVRMTDEQRSAAGMFERFAEIISRPHQQQEQQQQHRGAGAEYTPG